MLNQAGRNTAPFHLGFKQSRQMESGASHCASEDDCTPEESRLSRFARNSIKIIDVSGVGIVPSKSHNCKILLQQTQSLDSTGE